MLIWTSRRLARGSVSHTVPITLTGFCPRWLASDTLYEATFREKYEPWVICDRLLAPLYDARFRGYGQNKIVHLEHMNHTGFK